jgi:SAM-dependent methyltransferase
MTDTFILAGRCFEYAVSDYNGTRFNERAVEVPVGLALLGQASNGECSVLEVGAVLPHYRAGWPQDGHTVIDLHEVYPGVTNADVLTWEPNNSFDLIISISTLDHLHDYEELIDALRRLRRWLAPGGLLYITLPFGQPSWVGGGEWLDRFLLGENDAKVVWRMDKIDSLHHLWVQVDLLDLDDAPLAYHGRSPAANTVYMLLWGDVRSWWQACPLGDCDQ